MTISLLREGERLGMEEKRVGRERLKGRGRGRGEEHFWRKGIGGGGEKEQ